MEKELICIVCPIGCRLQITGTPDNLNVEGNLCKKGIGYANDEINNPTRMICSTVRIKGGIHSVLPVKTDKPIPEKYKFEIIKLINRIEVTSPVKMGTVLISDVFGTGVNVVATRNM
jgi:CxxC motif-containing protein